MIKNQFQDLEISRLGFGAMRLPTVQGAADGPVDEKAVDEMVSYAMEHGVNYFDTAYPYHKGESERIIGRSLRRFPREQYFLADKYPGHQISTTYDPAAVFEEQLLKCGVDYFDFYLLHNVYEGSIQTYLDERWGIVDYFVEQKKKGRIRHLGFSSHGLPDNLREFLDACGSHMEFCQIQLNYLDWSFQDAEAKCSLLAERGIPVWVMEPLRGGRLAHLSESQERRLKELRPQESIAAWAFRWLMDLPQVKVVLSGMSDLEQMVDNVRTFSESKPLDEKERGVLYEIAESLKDAVPCTSCRYCCDGCPKGLDIPMLISTYNEMKFSPVINLGMRLEALPEEKRPSACISCGKCTKVCPQKINIPQVMKDCVDLHAKMPSWEEVCRMRDQERQKQAENQKN